MRIKVPKEIKIGVHQYTIGFKPFLYDDEKSFGDVNFRTGKIRIEPTLPESQYNVSLLHEVLHTIDRNYSTSLPDGDLDRVASGIAEFLFNNLGIEFDWSDIKEE